LDAIQCGRDEVLVGTESGEEGSVDGIGCSGEYRRVGLFKFGGRGSGKVRKEDGVKGGEDGGDGGKEGVHLRHCGFFNFFL
jgi:hypothetical protein